MQLDLSIIIPVKNEQGNISELIVKLINVLRQLNNTYEIIIIDDGSTDGTLHTACVLKMKYKCMRVIELRRNFGKAVALHTGFLAAKGKYVITMDGDLQDDPLEIPNFITKLNDGYDVVSGWKKVRKDPLSKTLPSKLFNFLTSVTTGVYLHDFNCGFKAYKREVVKSLFLYGELHRYIPALAYWKGFKIVEIPVMHHPRKSGKSKYGIARLLRGMFDLITVKYLTQYMDRPLHLFGSMGLIFFCAGFIAGIHLTYLWYLDILIWNRPLLILSVLLLILGVQFFFFGLIAEMITSLRVPDIKSMVRYEY